MPPQNSFPAGGVLHYEKPPGAWSQAGGSHPQAGADLASAPLTRPETWLNVVATSSGRRIVEDRRAVPRGRTAGIWGICIAWSITLACSPVASHAEDAEEPPQYAAPTTLDQVGRVLAAVMVNGQGPFRFVVDTGANRTAISARLAAALGLVIDTNVVIEVHGVTGSAVVPAVDGVTLDVGDFRYPSQRLPVLDDVIFSDADGILGVEALQNHRVEIDFVEDKVTVRRSSARRMTAGTLVVPATLARGGLLLVKGRVGKIRTNVIIDTGAERTIGNLALHRALVQSRSSRIETYSTVIGATPGVVQAIALDTPTIAIGDARLNDVIVSFADLHVFSLWDLGDEPALVVGMDVLGTVEHMVVDYGRKEFHFRPPGADQETGYRDCSRSRCSTGTRLPAR
jgi:predicted aspartyl protease